MTRTRTGRPARGPGARGGTPPPATARGSGPRSTGSSSLSTGARGGGAPSLRALSQPLRHPSAPSQPPPSRPATQGRRRPHGSGRGPPRRARVEGEHHRHRPRGHGQGDEERRQGTHLHDRRGPRRCDGAPSWRLAPFALRPRRPAAGMDEGEQRVLRTRRPISPGLRATEERRAPANRRGSVGSPAQANDRDRFRRWAPPLQTPREMTVTASLRQAGRARAERGKREVFLFFSPSH